MKPSIRFEVFKRDAFTCAYCGRRSPEVMLQVDHVLAASQGGTDDPENLVTSCEECNRGKAARPLVIGGGLQPAERAARIEEHEAQIAEYSKWLVFQRDRENAELTQLYAAYSRKIYASYERKDSDGVLVIYTFWQDVSARQFLKKLGYYELLDAVDIAALRFRPSSRSKRQTAFDFWRYYCGICWRKIKDPQ